MKNLMKNLLILTGLLLVLANCGAQAQSPASVSRDVTFIATSDCHYDAFENEDRNDRNRDTIGEMNAVNELSWPDRLGAGSIPEPRGVVVLGDVIDDGDRIFQDKHQTPRQYLLFQADFGLDGKDGLLDYPVFESWGNHDGPPIGEEKHGFSFQSKLKERNLLRKRKGWLANLSENGLHYSWDWDDVHFVQLGIYPADRQHAEIRYNPVWHNPQNALAFLEKDLAENVGKSGRPVVLMSHCGIDADWWHESDKKAFHESVRDYNVLLYLYGHSGTGFRHWAPNGSGRPLNCINTGQTENGFFVIQITDASIKLAYRAKQWTHAKSAEGKPVRNWNNRWEWKHIVEIDLTDNHP